MALLNHLQKEMIYSLSGPSRKAKAAKQPVHSNPPDGRAVSASATALFSNHLLQWGEESKWLLDRWNRAFPEQQLDPLLRFSKKESDRGEFVTKVLVVDSGAY